LMSCIVAEWHTDFRDWFIIYADICKGRVMLIRV
jgi:hypothetical protein